MDIGITEKKAIAEQLRGEILTALASGGPLTARELYDRCDSAEEIANMTNQLGVLQKDGRVEKSGMRPADGVSRGARSVPEYRLVAEQSLAPDQAAKLADVIEATMETAWSHIPETDRVAHPEIVKIVADLDHDGGTPAGTPAETLDLAMHRVKKPGTYEFEYEARRAGTPFDDPISAAISSLKLAPTITDPKRQASRLCDLADMNAPLEKPSSAIVADAIPRELTLTALASMPLDRLAILARDIADVGDRLDALCALHGIGLEDAA